MTTVYKNEKRKKCTCGKTLGNEKYICLACGGEVPAVQWTSDPPTVDGFYWVRWNVPEFNECGTGVGNFYVGDGYCLFDMHDPNLPRTWPEDGYVRSTEPMEVPE